VSQLLVVGCGGFLGAVARYSLSGYLERRMGAGLPLGTLGVNVLGCLLIGILMALIASRESFSPELRLLLSTGFLGSLTTFSTFGFETIELLRAGDMRLALLSVALNLVLGLLAVLSGSFLVRLFQ
jgi:CrcB protein